MDLAFAPDAVPVLGAFSRCRRGCRRGPHALLELDRKADEGGDGEFEADEALCVKAMLRVLCGLP